MKLINTDLFGQLIEKLLTNLNLFKNKKLLPCSGVYHVALIIVIKRFFTPNSIYKLDILSGIVSICKLQKTKSLLGH